MGTFRKFEYLEPSTINEAIMMLQQHDGSLLLAGGTDLLVKMQDGKLAPQVLISLTSIPGLDTIRLEDSSLSIGAMVTHSDLEKSALIRREFALLADAAREIGSPQIRNVATIGGNLCNAAPSADLATPLIALNAVVKLTGPNGERILPLENLFTGPSKTILAREEVMTEIKVPRLPPHSGGAFIKYAVRNAMELALISVSVVLTLDVESGVCTDARIAMGVVAPVPIRAKSAESVLIGKKLDEKLTEQAGLAAVEEARPRSSFRASAEYRREVLKVLMRRAINKASERVVRQTEL